MITTKQSLIIIQVDRKLQPFKSAGKVIVPPRGWIYTIRNTVQMSLSQMGKRFGITASSIKEIEEREVSGSITLNTLREAGKALNLKLVYGFIPVEGTINRMIDKRARELATQIILRTAQHMMLEDQGTDEDKIRKAIRLQAEELKQSNLKNLWD